VSEKPSAAANEAAYEIIAREEFDKKLTFNEMAKIIDRAWSGSQPAAPPQLTKDEFQAVMDGLDEQYRALKKSGVLNPENYPHLYEHLRGVVGYESFCERIFGAAPQKQESPKC